MALTKAETDLALLGQFYGFWAHKNDSCPECYEQTALDYNDVCEKRNNGENYGTDDEGNIIDISEFPFFPNPYIANPRPTRVE